MELEKDQLSGANRNWIAFQRWLDISNNDFGVTWCSLDAPVFESGTITANIIGGATNSPQWIKKLEPSSTIYSWALNNHWHTNFPLSQEGKVQFRYRILPHNVKYDAALANRFGIEQAQPLIAAPVRADFTEKIPIEIKGSPSVYISMFRSDDNGNVNQVRLRSVSDKDESIKIIWPDNKPLSMRINDASVTPDSLNINNEIIVPAMGFVTVDVVW